MKILLGFLGVIVGIIGAILFVTFAIACYTGIILAVCLPLAYPFMWLWNYAVVFAFPTITVALDYWHAYWLLAFLSFFFAGARFRGTTELSQSKSSGGTSSNSMFPVLSSR